MYDYNLHKDRDNSKLEKPEIFGEIDLMIKNVRSGVCCLYYKEICWNIFLNQKDGNLLLVVLNGRRKKGKIEFKRWSWNPFVGGTMLNIDDPMIQRYDGLELGWYFGTDDEDYCDYIVEMVQSFAKITNANKVIFYGSSGGGSAAIRCAAKYEGSMSVTINPQLFLSIHSYSACFQKITGLNLNDCRERSWNYISNNRSKHIICMNRKSKADMLQLEHCLKTCNFSNVGLHSIRGNCLLWLYDANSCDPHSAQEWSAMHLGIMNLVEHFWNLDSLQLKKMYTNEYYIYSYFWEEHYEFLDKIKRQSRAINKIDIKQKNLCLGSESVVFSESEISILPSKNRFNRYRLSVELESNAMYYVVIRQDNNVEIPFFLIKDTIYQPILFKEKIETGVTQFAFVTQNDVEGVEVDLCPSQPQKNEGAGAVIAECTIYKL